MYCGPSFRQGYIKLLTWAFTFNYTFVFTAPHKHTNSPVWSLDLSEESNKQRAHEPYSSFNGSVVLLIMEISLGELWIPSVEWPPEPGEGDHGGGEVELLLLAQLARVLAARAGLAPPPAGAVRRQHFLEASLKLVSFVESSIWTEEANLIYSHFCSYKCRWLGSTKLKIWPALSGTPSHTGAPSKPN